MPYHVFGVRAGAAAVISAWTFLAMARSGSCILAIAASSSVFPSALAASALSSRTRSRAAAFSSALNALDAGLVALVRFARFCVVLVAVLVGAILRAPVRELTRTILSLLPQCAALTSSIPLKRSLGKASRPHQNRSSSWEMAGLAAKTFRCAAEDSVRVPDSLSCKRRECYQPRERLHLGAPASFRPQRPRYRQHVYLHTRRLSLGADNALRGRLEILRRRGRDVHEGLWIAIHEWKPAALHLHHDAVAATKHVVYIGHREVHGFNAPRRKRLGLLEALPKLSAKGPAADELLIPREPHDRRADVRPSRRAAVSGGIAPVRRIDIDQFHHPVGVGPGRRNEEPR